MLHMYFRKTDLKLLSIVKTEFKAGFTSDAVGGKI